MTYSGLQTICLGPRSPNSLAGGRLGPGMQALSNCLRGGGRIVHQAGSNIICVCACICMCVCLYKYIYIYIHIRISSIETGLCDHCSGDGECRPSGRSAAGGSFGTRSRTSLGVAPGMDRYGCSSTSWGSISW